MSTYYPYLFGKQYELIALREYRDFLDNAGFTPIIEPVRESTTGLRRALEDFHPTMTNAIVIINPSSGHFSFDHSSLMSDIDQILQAGNSPLHPGILLSSSLKEDTVRSIFAKYAKQNIAIIHSGFNNVALIKEMCEQKGDGLTHIFNERYCGKLYRREFQSETRVLLRDGFEARRNRDYPLEEPFSDLHITFLEERMSGFGDFTIVGSSYTDSGGPAYAIALHLTFIDPNHYNAMRIYHFVSDRTDTPTDPAGKFLEALRKLVDKVNESDSKILRTRAVEEYINLYKAKHFPGLGTAKKLSIQHHFEVLHHFLPKS